MIDESSVSSSKVTIEAPAQFVWDILVDFERYGEWNEFCPEAKAVLELGAPVEMKVNLGNGLQAQTEYITEIDAPHKIVWSMRNEPGDPIHADRTQRIEPIDDERCTYFSIDEFSGEALAPMMKAMAEPVERGFERCAQGLKKHAERLYRESRSLIQAALNPTPKRLRSAGSSRRSASSALAIAMPISTPKFAIPWCIEVSRIKKPSTRITEVKVIA